MQGLPLCAHAENSAIELMAVQSPPMAMENETERGAVLELVMAATERAGLATKVTFIPWRRAQEMVTGGKDLLITPLTWLPSRAERFTWIAPVCRMERAIASLKHRIDSLEQARSDRRILVVGAGSAQEQQLRDWGYPGDLIVTTPLGTRETEMLASGRVDGWYSGTQQIRWRWQREGRTEALIIGTPITVDQIHLGCSRDCDPTLVATLRSALQSLRDDGSSDRILAKYALSY
ncbi:ABC transporter substrate-binding protein [Niveispirillum sp.]|uniref:substrate-binding periplasmic protein n=1 Tax=Niveispirillum sp. TaxID=1917217 RepID=UPI001B473D42|nr:transporter substrate-binding domain-containing protein [Niveispirillum sp.]MBP7336929.1 transporter substrate-binding domain-containing protein [Niveispirillum sp.]